MSDLGGVPQSIANSGLYVEEDLNQNKMKVCRDCGIELNNKRSYCNPCGAKRTKKFFQINGRVRNRLEHIPYRYSITIEQYNKMILDSSGQCEICLREYGKPYVDHDSVT